jgi:hypothetical protein
VSGVLIIMNNYFHDVATAVLLGSAIIMWTLGRQVERGTPDEAAALAKFYPTLTKFAWGAVAWIVVGGIPRTIFFTTYEWDPAVIKGIVPALVVKHVLMALAVLLGVLLWRSVRRRIESSTARR